MPDLSKLKRNRLDQIRGQETVNQIEHISSAGAKLVMSGILVPGDVEATDTSAAPVLVKAGSILRIQVAADTYVAFGAEPAQAPINAAVTSSTTPAIKLPAGYHIVVATDDFIRSSAALTRLEVVTV